MGCQNFIRWWWRVALSMAFAAASAGPAPAATILVLGDSLSAAYGIELEAGWVSLLAERLGAEHRVVNASISGDTTVGGLGRLEPALAEHAPDVVIVELGGNDGLRGLPLPEIRRNLERIVERVHAAGGEVVLAGMRIPPNFGPVYAERFHRVYAQVAAAYEVALVPFLLEGVAADPDMMQPDGIHPRARAQPRVLENVWAVLSPLLASRE